MTMRLRSLLESAICSESRSPTLIDRPMFQTLRGCLSDLALVGHEEGVPQEAYPRNEARYRRRLCAIPRSYSAVLSKRFERAHS
jgi:hypothetical protein